MAGGAQIVQHKNKDIYYIDYSNIKTTGEFLKTMREAAAFREKVRAMGKKDLLVLVNITDSYLNVEILDELKKAGRIISEMTKKEAIVGITGYKKILLQIVQTFANLNFQVFRNIDDAKDWLVKD
ncbi:MAG: hypothetical protein JW723_10490 [Bacteroidales bacterium]|nr:hypothetical protein [Bacteroidales bacterium]